MSRQTVAKLHVTRLMPALALAVFTLLAGVAGWRAQANRRAAAPVAAAAVPVHPVSKFVIDPAQGAQAGDIPVSDSAVRVVETYPVGQPRRKASAKNTPLAPAAADPASVYSNITNFSGQAFSPAGQANTPAITRLMADQLVFTGTAPYSIGQFQFSMCNLNAASVSARPRVRFYLDNAGTPGANITGFSFNPLTVAASSCTTFFANVAPFSVTSSTLWAGMVFDNSTATATATQLNGFGMGIFPVPDAGTSADSFYLTTAAPPAGGSYLVNNPGPGATQNLGGNPVANFGWDFRLAATIASIVRANPDPRTASGTAQWTVTTSGAQLTGLTGSNFTLTGTHMGASITTVASVNATTWTVTANLGSGTGTLGLNFANVTNLNTNVSNTLPFAGEVYTVVAAATSVNLSSVTGGQDGNPNLIVLQLDAAGTNFEVLIDTNTTDNGGVANPTLFLSQSAASTTAFTVTGATDADTLVVRANASGQLPQLTGSASGAHNNTAFTNANAAAFVNAAGNKNVGLHFDGGANSDTLRLQLGTAENVAYFADEADTANSGVVSIAGDLNLSFENLLPLVVVGAGGSYLVDASANASLTSMTLSNIGAANDGVSRVDGNGTFEDTDFSGFATVTVRSGDGSDTITVSSLDGGAPTVGAALTNLTLDTGNIGGTDTSADTVNVLSISSTGSVAINTGAGLDVINIGNNGTVGAPGLLNPIAGAVTLDGGADGANLTIDGSGLNAVASYTITGTNVTRSSPSGFGGVTYANLSVLSLVTGGGVDNVTVSSTATGVTTSISTNAGDDAISLADGASLNSGTINGGGDNDTLTVNQTGGTTFNITSASGGTFGANGNFAAIENLVGATGKNDTFIVENLGSINSVYGGGGTGDFGDKLTVNKASGATFTGQPGANTGSATGVGQFVNVPNLAGSSANDTFIWATPGSILTGKVSAGDGNNIIFAGPATSVQGGIESGNGNDTITIGGGTNNISSGDGNDTISFGATAAFSGTIDGGSGTDTLNVGTNSTVLNHVFTNANSGSLEYTNSNRSFPYTNMESVVSTATTTSTTLSYSGVSETIALTDSGTAGRTSATSGAGVTFEFVNPSNLLTVNGGDGGGTILFTSLGSGFNAGITVNGGTGADSVRFATDINFAADKNLTVNLQDDALDPGTDSFLLTANTNLTLSGTGTVLVQVSGFVRMNAGSSLTTAAGNITLEGNRQAVPTGSLGYGINLISATVETSTGSIALRGRGSTATDTTLVGVQVSGGSIVRATGASGARNITLDGIGAVSGSSNAYGIRIQAGSQVTTTGGAVNLIGAGGATAADTNNEGVVIEASLIQADGGPINITGTSPGFNGVALANSLTVPARILSNGAGAITITATGGPNSADYKDYNNSGPASVVGGPNATGPITINANTIDIATPGAGTPSLRTTGLVTLRPRTAGTPINLGGADVVGATPTLGLTDAELDLINAPTVAIGEATSGAITISAPISRPTSTNVNLMSGGAIIFNPGSINTAGGNLSFDAGTGGVQPISSGVDATASSVSLTAGDDLAIALNGTALDTQYNTLSVNGTVNVTGANLVLSGSYTPVVGDSFTIVNNDLAEVVTGTFSGLPQGALVGVFSGVSLYINYLGGDGNDVVLTTVPSVMAVSGNGNPIANGSATPAATNDTDFGTTAVSGGLVTKTFTIANTGPLQLNLTGMPDKVVLSGTNATDFSVTAQPNSPVAATNGTTTFQITFDPSAAGTRTATVSIANNDQARNPYTFAIQGGGCLSSLAVQNNSDSGAGSLRQAILDACPGATITFANSVVSPITLTSGELVINKNLTIQGPGANLLTVQRSTAPNTPDFRIFNIGNGTPNLNVTLTGLTIANGKSTGIFAQGGGILYNSTGTLHVTNSTLSNNSASASGGNNTAAEGGGIGNLNGTVNVTNSILTNNSVSASAAQTADALGGGIYNTGTLNVTNSTLSNNSATANSSSGFGNMNARGGGIRNVGTLNVSNSTLANNSTLVTNHQLRPNSEGGGISNNGTGNVVNSTLANNFASVSAGNVPTIRGGGIFNFIVGRLKVTHSTLTNNSASEGGGIYNENNTTPVMLNNTIVALNLVGVNAATGSDLAGSFTSLGYNLIGNNQNATLTPAMDDQIGTNTNPLEPRLGPLADNGGPTPTQRPLPGSTVINAAATATDPITNATITTDQRGFTRSQGSAPDIGAVEVNYALAATSGSGQSANVTQPFINPLLATLTESGLPVNGVQLTFTAPGSGASATFSTPNPATTNASGQASVTATANAISGGYSVTANTTPGLATLATFTLTNTCPSFSAATPVNGALGVTYTGSVAAMPVVSAPFSYRYALANGTTLPPGLALDANTGAITGTPTAANTFNFDIRVELLNSGNPTGCEVINSRSLAITCTTDPIVMNANDSGAGSLRDAIAIACPGSTITFANGISLITLTTGELVISKNLTIQGPGAPQLAIVSGDETRQVFLVNNSAVAGISRLTIRGRSAAGVLALGGAAVTVSQAVLTDGDNGAAAIGGALTIIHSTLANNSNGVAATNSSTATIIQSTLANNQTGVFVRNSTVALKQATVTANVFGVTAPSGTTNLVNVTNSLLVGNTTDRGIFNTFNDNGGNLIGVPNGFTLGQVVRVDGNNKPRLADYGGPAQTVALAPGSPAINGGNNALAVDANNQPLPNDQRGFPRQIGTVDSGAVEMNYALAATGGTPQSATVTTAFANALQATLTESGQPVNGVQLTFTAPGGGASASFTGNPATTNASGQASVNATANATVGSYSVTANTTPALATPASFNLSNSCPTITLSALPGGTVGAVYNTPLGAAGGVAPYAFSVTGGALPNGLTLFANGTWSGVPTAAGTFNFTVTATDGFGCTGSRAYSVTVNCGTLTLAPNVIPGGAVGAAYNQQLTVSGAFGNSAAFSVVSGALPNGVTLSGAGLLSGTPTAAGTFSFTVRAQDSLGCFATQAYTLNVACTPLTINPASLPNAQANVAFSQQLNATGAAPRTFTLSANPTPPNWLTLSAGGLLTGTPPAPGNFSFAVNVSDAQGCTGTQSYTLTVGCPTLTLGALPNATAGNAYAANLNASPVGTYQFSSTDKPAWLTLAANGGLSGTPANAGTANFTVTVSGPSNCTQTLSVSLAVACPTLTVNPTTLPTANLGAAYTQTLTATPGSGHSFSVTTGALPGGLTLNANGTLSGTPTAAGTFSFTVTATAFGTCTGTRAYSLTVTNTCSTVTVNPTTLPGGTLGVAYNQTVSASPAGTYTFSVVSGALPPGLTLDANTGAISGTPTAGGSFTPTIKATAGSCSGQRLYVISIACAAVTISPTTLPNATPGVAYSQQLTANVAGTFSLLLGSLPPGLNLSSTGLLNGMTTQPGSYNITVRLTAGTCSGTRAYTLIVGGSMAALALQGDYDGDGKADPALWSNTGAWRIANSGDQQTQTPSWGAAGDVSLLGDYDGDGKTDLAVFRPGNGTWYVKRSSDGGTLTRAWGAADDVLTPGDYDGDGKTDLAVWRPSEGNWYVLRSLDQQYAVTAWGLGSAPYYDAPVPGDYDGDGKTDLAVFRRSTGTWLVKRSSDGQFTVKAWGLGTDVPVAADYDGDGKTDIAVWRNGTWYIWQSASNSARVTEWGANYAPYYDQAAPGDYDGDGRADVVVWRAAEQTWYVRCSADSTLLTRPQGVAGDAPVAARRP